MGRMSSGARYTDCSHLPKLADLRAYCACIIAVLAEMVRSCELVAKHLLRNKLQYTLGFPSWIEAKFRRRKANKQRSVGYDIWACV